MKRNITITVFFVFAMALGLPGNARECEFSLQSDRIWYRSEGEQLESFLERFAGIGVDVHADPSIEQIISGDCKGEKLADCLNNLLQPLGYVLRWDVVGGPVDGLVSLNSIKVFRPGHRDEAKPYSQAGKRKMASHAGRRFIADELLLGFDAGTDRTEVELLLSQLGGTITDCIESLGVYRVRFSPGANIPALADQLERNPIVAHSEPNYVTRLQKDKYSVPDLAHTDPVDLKIDPEAQAYLAVLDSGLDARQIPQEVIAGSFNAIAPNETVSDSVGHGTHMALLASGLVSPAGVETEKQGGIPLVAVQTFDEQGYTSNYDLMRAISYSLDNGARVINLSWGSEYTTEFVANAVSRAQSAGAIIVAAAGNDPTGEAVYPAALPGVLAISATDRSGNLWGKSNYGDFIFGAAPGMANLPRGDSEKIGSYGGTSIASAYTAGVIAKYVALHPDSEAKIIVDRFRESLSKTGLTEKETGNGVLNDTAVKRFLEGTSQ